VRSRNIQADILAYLSDGKLHTMQEIADEVEVCERTVRRHIQDLSYRFNIQTFCGRDGYGGVRYFKEKSVDIDYLNNDELQLIIDQLSLLQNSDVNIKRFIKCLSSQVEKEQKENDRKQA